MHFPVDDVVRNIRHFMASVKRVTGNAKDEESRRAKNAGAKPGKKLHDRLQFNAQLRVVTTISKVILSSGQGPGIRIADI